MNNEEQKARTIELDIFTFRAVLDHLSSDAITRKAKRLGFSAGGVFQRYSEKSRFPCFNSEKPLRRATFAFAGFYHALAEYINVESPLPPEPCLSCRRCINLVNPTCTYLKARDDEWIRNQIIDNHILETNPLI